jgi:hypothetical protein
MIWEKREIEQTFHGEASGFSTGGRILRMEGDKPGERAAERRPPCSP